MEQASDTQAPCPLQSEAERNSVPSAGELDYLDLYWLPVGAGTHFQKASLVLYERVAATLGRRPRGALYHTALKFALDGRAYTLELMPVPAPQGIPSLMTGPVGVRGADRIRILRYQLLRTEQATLPDEQWAVDSPDRLPTTAATIGAMMELAPAVPAHTWGRRVVGTSEMWTSNSAISWLLTRVGVSAEAIPVPAGGRAPGWHAGIQAAKTGESRFAS